MGGGHHRTPVAIRGQLCRFQATISCHLACLANTVRVPRCSRYPKSWDCLATEVLAVGARCLAPIHSQCLWMQPASAVDAAPVLSLQRALRQVWLA